MEGPAGWTMIVHSTSRHQLTHHCDEIRFYRHSRHPPSGPGQGAMFCTFCHEVDHTRAQCALLCLHRPAPPLSPTTPRHKFNICISCNRGSCIFIGILFVPPATCHTKRGMSKDSQWLHLQAATWLHFTTQPTCSTYCSAQCQPMRPAPVKQKCCSRDNSDHCCARYLFACLHV